MQQTQTPQTTSETTQPAIHTETGETTSTTTETAEAEGELVTFEQAMEMVDTISHMKYRMESSDGNWSTIEYTVLGEE